MFSNTNGYDTLLLEQGFSFAPFINIRKPSSGLVSVRHRVVRGIEGWGGLEGDYFLVITHLKWVGGGLC